MTGTRAVRPQDAEARAAATVRPQNDEARAAATARPQADEARAVASVRPRDDEGSAVVEFLGLTLVLLLPLVYLVLVLGRLEAAAFAVEGAAREAARTYVASDTEENGARRAIAATGLALRDQGFDDDPAGALTIACDGPCLTPGGEVTAFVEVVVPLPFVPGGVRDVVPLEIPVSAQRSAPVDEFRQGG